MTSTGNDDYLRVLVVMAAAGLSLEQVWLNYFALTGDASELELDAYLHGLMKLPEIERQLLFQALNELVGFPADQNAPAPLRKDP